MFSGIDRSNSMGRRMNAQQTEGDIRNKSLNRENMPPAAGAFYQPKKKSSAPAPEEVATSKLSPDEINNRCRSALEEFCSVKDINVR